MLAQIEPTRNDFQALANYLIHGKERPTHPDRVAWVIGHNVPTDDPSIAAKLMAATAERSKRCANACYHMSVNWHPDEQPSPEIMQEIARRTLDLAGLAEHQALVMGHGDKPHKHMHFMINRVHPDTGRAWSTSHDYRRFDRIMKQLSDEYGFQYVPPHSFHPELTDDLPKAPNSNARYAAKHGAPTDRMQWSAHQSREFGATISETLDRASSWDDIETAVAEHGLLLETKGQDPTSGLVIGNADSYTKFSKLGLTLTAKGFEKRFGSPYAPPDRSDRQQSRRPPRPRWDTDRITAERDRLRLVVTGSCSWLELEQRLAGLGLMISRKGNGMVLSDPAGEAALSALGWSKAKLDAHFGDPLGLNATNPKEPRLAPKPKSPRHGRRADRRLDRRLDHHRSAQPARRRSPPLPKVRAWAASRTIWTIDAIDIARAIGSKDDLRQAVQEARATRKARLAGKPLMVQLLEELKEQLKASTILNPSASRPPRRQARRSNRPRKAPGRDR